MSIGIIGEAASHISQDFRVKQHQIAWQPIIGMRNFVIHAYFRVDTSILWNTIEIHIPILIAQLETIFSALEDSK